MLLVSCPQCRSKLQAPDESVGKLAKCGNCGHEFELAGAPTAAIELAPLQPASRASSPPPLIGQSIPNGPAWVLAVLPSVCLLIVFLGMAVLTAGNEVAGAFLLTLLLLLIANTVCFWLDFSRLRRVGKSVPSWTCVAPVPVYLFLRASRLRQRPVYAYAWIFGCALWILAFTQIPWSLPAALFLLVCEAICRLAALFSLPLLRETYKS